MTAAPDRPGRAHHVAIQCVDLEGMAAFYQRVLGLALVRRWPGDDPHQPGDRSVWLDLGGCLLMLERSVGPARAPTWRSDATGLHLLAMEIEGAQRPHWKRWLQQHGHSVVAETDHTLYLRDPEGNRIGLSHYPSPTVGDRQMACEAVGQAPTQPRTGEKG